MHQDRKPKVIGWPASGARFTRLLGGPPEKVGVRSGAVMLLPGESIGQHSTRDNEEVIIVLEGEGELHIRDEPALPLGINRIGYCPPDTVHDVVNTGTTPLRYLFVVSRAAVEAAA